MQPINQQTPGPLNHWPTHWAGGSDSRKIDGHNTVWLDSVRGELARIVPNGSRVDELTMADARLLAAGFTAFDKAGRALGVDAAELGEKLDLVFLIRAARKAAHATNDHDTVFARIELHRALEAFHKLNPLTP